MISLYVNLILVLQAKDKLARMSVLEEEIQAKCVEQLEKANICCQKEKKLNQICCVSLLNS